MADSPREFTNPYASPATDELTQPVAAEMLPLSREIWLATILIWCGCTGLGLAAGYVLVAWLNHQFRWGIQIDRGAELAQFATGAANALVMSALLGYGQYHAVIRRDAIWTRSLGLLLLIGSAVIALGSVLIFTGSPTMWLLLLPASVMLFLSLMMFRWYSRLHAFRRQQRRTQKGRPYAASASSSSSN
jgi:hypothetical protein